MTMHMMIDLETLSTRKSAVIVQLGWCNFNPDGAQLPDSPLGHEVNVSVDSCLELGGCVSDSTIRWWLSKSVTDEARASVSRKGRPVASALNQLSLSYELSGCSAVWAHGSIFDIAILEYYYEALQLSPPWNYYDVRDTRTLFAEAERLGWEKEVVVTAHTAMADAVQQAKWVQSARRGLSPAREDKFTGNVRPPNNHCFFADPEKLP